MARGIRSVAVVLSAFLTQPVFADNPTQQSYDVRDLLIDVQDFKPNQPARPAATRESLVNGLLATVRGALPAEDQAAPIKEEDGKLAVTGDAAVQTVVGKTLAALRQQQQRQIMLEARVLELSDDVLATLPEDLRIRVWTARANSRSAILLDDMDKAHLVRLAKQPSSTQLTAPRLTLFGGQRAFVLAQSQTNYVKDLHKVTGNGGEAAYEPVIDHVDSGVSLFAQASSLEDLSACAVSLELKLDQLLRMENVSREGGVIQKPYTATDTFQGTFAIPAGQTMLIGYADHAQIPAGDLKGQKVAPIQAIPVLKRGELSEDRQIYVLITATAIRPTAEPAEKFPLLTK